MDAVIEGKNKYWHHLFKYVQRQWRKRYKVQGTLNNLSLNIVIDITDIIYPILMPFRSPMAGKCRKCAKYQKVKEKLRGVEEKDIRFSTAHL